MAASANAIKLRRSNKIQKSTGEKVSQFFIYFFITLFALACVVPFILVLIVSFSEEKSHHHQRLFLLPRRLVHSGLRAAVSPQLLGAPCLRHHHFRHGGRHRGGHPDHLRRRLHPGQQAVPLPQRPVAVLLHHHGVLRRPGALVHDLPDHRLLQQHLGPHRALPAVLAL